MAFAPDGCQVIAVDLDARKVDAIAAGRSHIEDVPCGSATSPRDREKCRKWPVRCQPWLSSRP
jgi:UDP-N-acetyl-D-mannosaminuronate dehydrogenase